MLRLHAQQHKISAIDSCWIRNTGYRTGHPSGRALDNQLARMLADAGDYFMPAVRSQMRSEDGPDVAKTDNRYLCHTLHRKAMAIAQGVVVTLLILDAILRPRDRFEPACGNRLAAINALAERAVL